MPKMKKIWDNRQFIGEVFKSESTKFIIELVAREGVKYVSIREWYTRKRDPDGVWKPGMTGIVIPIHIPISGQVAAPAADLITLLNAAYEMQEAFKIDDPANAVWIEEKPR